MRPFFIFSVCSGCRKTPCGVVSSIMLHRITRWRETMVGPKKKKKASEPELSSEDEELSSEEEEEQDEEEAE